MEYLMTQMGKPIRFMLSTAILSAGVALMILGILRGELRDILIKAIIICRECIGIG